MNRKKRGKFLFACIALILVLVIVYSGLQILESIVLLQGQQMEVVARKRITKDGVDYFPRQDINVIMLLGINQSGEIHPEAFNDSYPADMIALMIFDEAAGECKVLNINRDTMVDMPILAESGRENGTFYGQIGYSHTFGTGMEDSCENTRKTVSNLFYGVTIDYYVSMNIGAVPVLNDAVGGVTVNVVDDFSLVDTSIPKGLVTLNGEQARVFVQTRWDITGGLNLARIERQKEYMARFAETFRSKSDASGDFIMATYEKVAPYILSDLPVSTLTGMVERYQDYPVTLLSLEGDNVLGETYYEFYPDEEKLEDLILELFYTPM